VPMASRITLSRASAAAQSPVESLTYAQRAVARVEPVR
jgi:hypothetical protein